MKHDVVAPNVGESITEVSILKWLKSNGEAVESGETLLEIESDKATVEVVAENSGKLEILKEEGERIPVGEVIARIDESAAGTKAAPKTESAKETAGDKAATSSAPAPTTSGTPSNATPGPAARKMLAEKNLDASQISGSGKDGRVTKGDILSHNAARPAPASMPAAASTPPTLSAPSGRALKDGDRRVPMSNIRKKIAERLLSAQHNAAILTTFNEVDLSAVMDIRKEHKDKFKEKHGVSLSFMSFFTIASAMALREIPGVNAEIDGTDIIYHDYQDIGIAVGTERGLVVPVLRGAGNMGFVEIEKGIAAMAKKARDGKLSIADMTGGTFTISNGGTYGSMLSTPILNPPQSAILGMHNIIERPVAIDGKVVIRPMMYLALSYDHRMIDGKEAVTFLVTLRKHLENPSTLGLEY